MKLSCFCPSGLVVIVASAVLLVVVAPRRGLGFALIGPNRAEVNHAGGDHTPAGPELGHFQVFGAGFRWSTSELTYAFDKSFDDAFGNAGKQAVVRAFASWDAAFAQQNAPLTTGTQTNRAIADIQSIALHEIGHALGLHHTNMGSEQQRNYDKQGNLALANPGAVMYSKINFGEIQRALSLDDVEGIQYLYDPKTMIPTLNARRQIVQTAGPGDPDFRMAGEATMGGTVGANFDIFAMDLGDAVAGARTLIYGGAGVGGNAQFQNQAMGGFFDGVPIAFATVDNASHGQTLTSIDIIFNTSEKAMLGVNPAPEPATAALFALGAAIWAALMRRRRADSRC